mmetsp:Transcript_3139/g.4857  ORF Transcript_3139/g.4857 Transcript_3139/m.4857 type:complete len:289 (-) Transcript_3139:92-958(-)
MPLSMPVLWRIAVMALVSLSSFGYSDSCSRILSRRVRKFIEQDVFTQLSIDPTQLPEDCQLNPVHDMYLDQERHKSRSSTGNYKCHYCGKEFKNEFYMDRHMDNKHPDKILSNTTICLGDLCPIFGCSDQNTKYRTYHSRRERSMGEHVPEEGFAGMVTCSDAEVEKYRYKCEVLSRRCFSGLLSSSHSSETVADYFNDKICRALHCEKGVMRGLLVEEEDDEAGVLITVVRWMLGVVILVIALLYAFGSGMVSRLLHRPTQVKIGMRQRQSIFSFAYWRKMIGFKKD